MKLNLNGLTYEEYNSLTVMLQEGRFKAAVLLAVKLVSSWDLELAPTDPDLTSKLKFTELAQVIPEIMSAVKKELDEQSLDKYSVDLDKWTTDDFDAFQQATFNRDFATVSTMVGNVVKVNGRAISAPLSLVHGVLAMRAIGDAVGKVFAGKN